MQCQAQYPALTRGVDVRDGQRRLDEQSAVLHDAHTARTFRHKDATVWRKGQRPGNLQPRGKDLHADSNAILRREGLEWRWTAGRWRNPAEAPSARERAIRTQRDDRPTGARREQADIPDCTARDSGEPARLTRQRYRSPEAVPRIGALPFEFIETM